MSSDGAVIDELDSVKAQFSEVRLMCYSSLASHFEPKRFFCGMF